MHTMKGSKTKIKVIIVDDEPIARRNLCALLRSHADVEVIGECGNGAQAIKMIQSASPDLLFVDVQMPEMNGFEMLRKLDLARIPAIIFVTAYDQYALRAFEVQALDYLLKPFDDERFAQALARARTQIEQREAAGLKQRLLALLEGDAKTFSAQSQPAHEEKFLIKSASRIFFVKTEEIDWIEAADYYVCLHVGGESHLLRETMAEMEAKLDPAQFCRIHRSTIVNLQRIREVQSRNGEYSVVLADETALRLSRSRKEQIEQILNRML